MNRILKSVLAVVVAGVFFMSLNSSVYAGLNPKGWTKGKKKGWHGENAPPGLSEKEMKKHEKQAKKEVKKANKEAKKKAKEAERSKEKG